MCECLLPREVERRDGGELELLLLLAAQSPASAHSPLAAPRAVREPESGSLIMSESNSDCTSSQ